MTILTTIIVYAAGTIMICGLIYAVMRKQKAFKIPVQAEEPSRKKKVARKKQQVEQDPEKRPATIKPKGKTTGRKKPQTKV